MKPKKNSNLDIQGDVVLLSMRQPPNAKLQITELLQDTIQPKIDKNPYNKARCKRFPNIKKKCEAVCQRR